MKSPKNVSPRAGSQSITDEQQTFGALLRKPYEVLARRVYTRLAAEGYSDIRPAHSAVLRNMGANGSRITELADRAQMTKQSMGALVDYLRERGYLELHADPSDARAKIACLTERGQVLQSHALSISREAEQDLVQLVGGDDMQQLRALLERLFVALANE
jgi:DNA-binding MarR family transcriptional regulator